MNCTKKGVMNILGGEDSISLLTLYSALQVNLQLKVLVKTVHPFLNKQCIFSYKCETLFCLFIYHFFLLNEITYYKIVKRIKNNIFTTFGSTACTHDKKHMDSVVAIYSTITIKRPTRGKRFPFCQNND